MRRERNRWRVLLGRKWEMLRDWTDWSAVDQFGWDQPALEDVVGHDGRSKLSGQERPHDYQVAISFPGANFANVITDPEGRVLASSGTEMAEVLQRWIVDGWLGGNEQQGLSHVFVCSKNLRYCPGSIKARNFRHYSAGTIDDRSTEGSTAILNENWAMYVRESFIESRVVVFVINEDWLDSIPCNQEFEAVITRERLYGGSRSRRDAIIFFDITDDKFNQRWGAKLPQFKAGMAFEAGKFFDIFQFTYNQQTAPAQKAAVQRDFVAAVAQYGVRHPGLVGFADLMPKAREVHWPTWLYYGVLQGTNGWQTLVEVDQGQEDNYHAPKPGVKPVAVTRHLASRRFRVRVMGITGDTFNNGTKYMCRPIALHDKATGGNIVAAGKGYWRTAGERMHTLGFTHWVGANQHSWLEWLVPDDQPPVVLEAADVRVNARWWVVEAMPLEAWPGPTEADLSSYTFLGFHEGISAATSSSGGVADKPPKWVTLHQVDSVGAGGGGDDGGDALRRLQREGLEVVLPDDAPPCSRFRLRVTGSGSSSSGSGGSSSGSSGSGGGGGHLAASLGIKVHYPEGLYPLGGGEVTGSGGNCAMEDAPPAFAFDGSEHTRWVDVDGGGIGNRATLAYMHDEAVEVVEYSITAQCHALSSYHSHLNGAPRDWVLKVQRPDSGGWVVVDRQTHVYYRNHTEAKRFKVRNPLAGRSYMFEFTAVAAGCASRSIQIGQVELYAHRPARTHELQQHQLTVFASAYNSDVTREAARAACGGAGLLAPEYGISWQPAREGSQPLSRLQFAIPTHPGYQTATSSSSSGRSAPGASTSAQPAGQGAGGAGQPSPPPGAVRGGTLGAVRGGTLGWLCGEGHVRNLYDHPTEVTMDPQVQLDDPDAPLAMRAMLVVRPSKEPLQGVDHVHTVSFRREYPDGEVQLVYTHTRPFVLKGYSLRSCCDHVRGDPRSWALQAEASAGSWTTLHAVDKFTFPDRLAPLQVYLLDNTLEAAKYRLVILEMSAMAGLLHLTDFALYKELTGVPEEDADAAALPRKEAAHVTLKLKPREAPGGQVRPRSYTVGPHGSGATGSVPTGWVLEGYTSAY